MERTKVICCEAAPNGTFHCPNIVCCRNLIDRLPWLARVITERGSHWLSCAVVPRYATREALSRAEQRKQWPGEMRRCGPGHLAAQHVRGNSGEGARPSSANAQRDAATSRERELGRRNLAVYTSTPQTNQGSR
ncbi:hypothetical protein ISCGN_002733 [Ixodes scapularis]